MRFITEQFTDEDRAGLDGLLTRFARPGMAAFELGTYTGASALVTLRHIQAMGGRLTCVDWFRGTEDADGTPCNDSYRQDDIRAALVANLEEAGFRSLVTIVQAKTTDAVLQVPDESIDFLFVDANHTYTAVMEDLRLWSPKVRRGGLMCGHDFERHARDCDHVEMIKHCETDCVTDRWDGVDRHYGVIRAVSKTFPAVQRVGRIWWIVKD
jgi:predicted O-methyltransferase YrrM